MKKKLIAINLNEFNLKFLKKGSAEYNCKNISKLLKLKNIKTFTSDNVQNKNLDPWVQSISINTGMRSKKHRIFNLGEKIPKTTIQIWDILSRNNYKSAVWGPMNTNFINNKNIEIFIPDPWNHQNKVKPTELNLIYKLARIYAQNYTDFKIIKNIKYFSNFIYFILKSNSFIDTIKFLPLFIKIFLQSGLKSYLLFFSFDILSLIFFKNLTKNKNINFSIIFLNSIAHFQHNNWDQKDLYKNFFILTDYALKLIFEIYKKYDGVLIYNALSQKKIKKQYLLRPLNANNFFIKNGINFKSIHTNMTNGAIITFKNNIDLKLNFKKINKLNIFGFKLFEINIINKKQIFCRIQIRSHFDLSDKSTKLDLRKKIFFYDKNLKKTTKNINDNIFDFINSFSFIKTTSKHTPSGELFYHNFNFNKKRIHNIKIYNHIINYFSS